MVENAGKLAEQGTNELGTLGDLNIEQLLDGEGEALLVGHHGDVVKTVEVGESLQIRLVLDQLLGTAVQQADVRIGSDDLLAAELEDQTQHTVGSRMLGAEVDGVVSDLAVGHRVVARLLGRTGQLGAQAVRVVGIGEVVIDGDELRADRFGGGIFSDVGGREGAGGGSERRRSQAETLGSPASESVHRSHCELDKERRGCSRSMATDLVDGGEMFGIGALWDGGLGQSISRPLANQVSPISLPFILGPRWVT